MCYHSFSNVLRLFTDAVLRVMNGKSAVSHFRYNKCLWGNGCINDLQTCGFKTLQGDSCRGGGIPLPASITMGRRVKDWNRQEKTFKYFLSWRDENVYVTYVQLPQNWPLWQQYQWQVWMQTYMLYVSSLLAEDYVWFHRIFEYIRNFRLCIL